MAIRARGHIAAAVLAAGRSSRFGAPKLLAPIAGRPLIRATVESLLVPDLADILVVLGHEAERIETALRGLPVRCTLNPRFAEGIGTSVAAAVAALPPDAAAVLIALGDQPLPGPDIVTGLVAAYRGGGGPIVVPTFAGERGNPVLFDAALFPELLRLEGDEGARGLIAASERVTAVPFPFPPPPDVDTPRDYAALLRARRPRGA